MKSLGAWVGASGQNSAKGIAYSGGYLFTGLYVTPARAVKIDPATMTTLLTWTPSGHSFCFGMVYGGSYLFISESRAPAQVAKIDPSNMTTVATWVGASQQNNGRWLAYDGTFIFCVLNNAGFAGKCAKINASTMVTSLIWTGGAGQTLPVPIIYAAGYVYVGSGGTGPPAQVCKIDPATMTTVLASSPCCEGKPGYHGHCFGMGGSRRTGRLSRITLR
jgi:hypothetical protein